MVVSRARRFVDVARVNGGESVGVKVGGGVRRASQELFWKVKKCRCFEVETLVKWAAFGLWPSTV